MPRHCLGIALVLPSHMERERSQLVIGLGEGAEGQRLREALDRAARAAGKPITVWARETLLSAAGNGPTDPVIEVRINGAEVTLFHLRAIDAVQNGWVNKIRALVAGEWLDLSTNDPEELIARWKRVHRGS